MASHYQTLEASLAAQFAAEPLSEVEFQEIDEEKNRMKENFALPLRRGATLNQIYNATIAHYASHGFQYDEDQRSRVMGAFSFTNGERKALALLTHDPHNNRIDVTADIWNELE